MMAISPELSFSDVVKPDHEAQFGLVLKKQFRILSRALHPDKQPERTQKAATMDFQLLKLVKDTLGDQRNLSKYLRKLKAFRKSTVQVPWTYAMRHTKSGRQLNPGT